MKIGLIGAGRLGICLALLIERAGYDVLVSDVREDYVSNLNKKKIDTNEPGVRWYLKQTKRFEATTDNQRVINECDIIICLVATPSLKVQMRPLSLRTLQIRPYQKATVHHPGISGGSVAPLQWSKGAQVHHAQSVGTAWRSPLISSCSCSPSLPSSSPS